MEAILELVCLDQQTPGFAENFEIFGSEDLYILNIYLYPFPFLACLTLGFFFQHLFIYHSILKQWAWQSSPRTLWTLRIKNICKCFYAVMHHIVTLMSVVGQSHISFLPWRINNVVILAETGMSEPRAGSTLFSNLFFPKGPSSLVLFDSFIVNVLQSCCPGLSQESSLENNIINTVPFTGSHL